MAIPAVRALHDEGFEIRWACGLAVRPLLECYAWINLVPVDDRRILKGRLFDRARAIVQFLGKVGFKRYDLCATLYYDRRFHWLTLPVRARRKLALSRSSRHTALLPGRRQPDEFLRVLLSTQDTCRETSVPLVRPDRLPPSPLPHKRADQRIAIVAGGTRNVAGEQILRRWPIENYMRVIQQLLSRGWEVVLLGGPDDNWVSAHFQSLPVTDLIGKLSLPEVVSACDDCDAVISHDTGPLHLAGLSSACLLGIYGPTDPSVFLPRRPYSIGIWGGQGFACRPCYDGRDFAPCHFNGCMHQVTPEQVIRELDQMLKDRRLGMSADWRIVFPDTMPQPSILPGNSITSA